ncbi:DNA mismatch repair protein MutS [Antarcticibacterium flavum]|uniref:DNA mismatch repair protein MutS n=1 Tax=Antarcticibacterium flavum TaxID=2058175 RepID=A0A5B7WYQ8_9FLAO|nr:MULTISPECIES: Smr/MutS family protein [Antarcticibacterium]MCM4161179.1 DNA mismatch repair protein MutS [Antarcticibacterium sp. W02-3]QCY68316.1 DNA mismatch repair protein MutS [Antarcticibacterium flavum]
MKFKINDKVEVLDDALRGKVIDINGDQITIETTEGFMLQFHENELVGTNDEQSRLISTTDVKIADVLREKQGSKKPRSQRIKPKERNAPPMEVDLHIEKLVNSYRGMSNYDILTLQLDTAKRQIEFATRKRIQKIVFIHGVGEGVLKAELDFLLGRYDNLKFYDADYQKYGVGATEVYFFQNS